MTLQGNYNDDIFKFIKLTVEGCQLNEDECQPIDSLKDINFNFVMLRAYPNVEDET